MKNKFNKGFRENKTSGCLLPIGYDMKKFTYSDGEKNEKNILHAIKSSIDISYNSEELANKATNWAETYHLGMGRANGLNSLNIGKNSSILEMGSGCGAITRYLGENFFEVDAIEGSYNRAKITRERCRDLRNVKVYCLNISHFKKSKKYDVILLNGVLEYAPLYMGHNNNPREAVLNLLKHAKKFVKKNGIILIGIENRLGLKYFSGCPEDHTGNLYEGIYEYPNKYTPITFSKNEIIDVLNDAGYSHHHFLYCFPDYKIPSTIINEIGDKKKFLLYNWIEVPFYDHNREGYNLHEGMMLKNLSESGLLRDFANSFLIAASPSAELNKYYNSDWIIKKYSIKRKRKFQCITSLKIKPAKIVTKERFDGSKGEIFSKTKNFTIGHRIYQMRWLPGDSLDFQLNKILLKKEPIKEIAEVLRGYYAELLKQFYTYKKDADGYPLLKGGSIDFILSNLIRTKGRLKCIDNEFFVKENLPADYILYRSILRDIKNNPYYSKAGWNKSSIEIDLIRGIFPKYNSARNNLNKELELEFRKAISMGDYNIKSNNLSLIIQTASRLLPLKIRNFLVGALSSINKPTLERIKNDR